MHIIDVTATDHIHLVCCFILIINYCLCRASFMFKVIILFDMLGLKHPDRSANYVYSGLRRSVHLKTDIQSNLSGPIGNSRPWALKHEPRMQPG